MYPIFVADESGYAIWLLMNIVSKVAFDFIFFHLSFV
jgi:hypothetical protein